MSEDLTTVRPRPAWPPAPNPEAKPLHTQSLAWRLLALMLLVLLASLLALTLAFSQMYEAQAKRDIDGLVVSRGALAQSLKERYPPDGLVERVAAYNVHVRMVTAQGTVFESGPVPRSPGPPRVLNLKQGRHAGSTLTLTGDYALARGLHGPLQRALWLTGVGVLAVGSLLTWLALRYGLRPLNAMAAAAHRITGGERGLRFRPTNPSTELGRTAAAFDDMLDELEGAERRARAAEEKAQRSADRLKEFIADAAHELRTPLAGVRGAADALLLPGVSDADREHLTFLLGREAHRAGRMVGSLLDVARMDAGLELNRAPVDLVDLVAAEADRLRVAHPDLAIRLRVDAAQVGLLGDRERLASVVSNLTTNAARYAGEGQADGWIELALGRDAEHAFIGVTDSGPGIPDDQRERVFDRLVRLGGEAHATGAGLGLDIARGYARGHGGDVVCLPGEPGRGARFLVTLPLR